MRGGRKRTASQGRTANVCASGWEDSCKYALGTAHLLIYLGLESAWLVRFGTQIAALLVEDRKCAGLGARSRTRACSLAPPLSADSCWAHAVGDVHGDIRKAITSLGIAGVLAEDDAQRPVWVGGDTVVVQLGDVLDRGDHEIGAQSLEVAVKGALWKLGAVHRSATARVPI